VVGSLVNTSNTPLLFSTPANTQQKWSVLRLLAVVVLVACLMGGVEAGLIFAVRHAKEKGLHWPSILVAVASSTLLAAGVLRYYVDVYLYRTVRGSLHLRGNRCSW
jgi:flagellar biosynthesis protein FliQ